MGESQGEREPHLDKRKGDQSGSMERKGWTPQGRKTGRACKENLLRKSRKKHERVSGCKSSPGRSAESWFHSKSDQTRNENGG